MFRISIILLLSLFIFTGCSDKSENNESNVENISANRVSTSINNVATVKTTPVLTEISSFTTKIYTKTSERQNNIRITCSTLNGKTINPGETFSFVDTVRKGYC